MHLVCILSHRDDNLVFQPLYCDRLSILTNVYKMQYRKLLYLVCILSCSSEWLKQICNHPKKLGIQLSDHVISDISMGLYSPNSFLDVTSDYLKRMMYHFCRDNYCRYCENSNSQFSLRNSHVSRHALYTRAIVTIGRLQLQRYQRKSLWNPFTYAKSNFNKILAIQFSAIVKRI